MELRAPIGSRTLRSSTCRFQSPLGPLAAALQDAYREAEIGRDFGVVVMFDPRAPNDGGAELGNRTALGGVGEPGVRPTPAGLVGVQCLVFR